MGALPSLGRVGDDDGVLRPMQPDDVAAVLDVQEPAAIAGLAGVFPQELHPFPRTVISDRWRSELQDPAVDCFVIQHGGSVVGFAATRGEEVLHFGVALERWGSGLAVIAHDELVVRLRRAGAKHPWLRVYAGNPRGRAYWEKLGWQDTGERTRGAFPPHPELLTYELRRQIDRNRA